MTSCTTAAGHTGPEWCGVNGDARGDTHLGRHRNDAVDGCYIIVLFIRIGEVRHIDSRHETFVREIFSSNSYKFVMTNSADE